MPIPIKIPIDCQRAVGCCSLLIRGILSISAACVACLPNITHAQEEVLQELDTTDIYGDLSEYQAWPLSAGAISGDDLQLMNRSNQRELTDLIPNFSQTDSGLRSFGDVVSMRGLTNTPFFGNASVVQYVDDVPMGNVFSYTTPLHAVERAEVFRGPQGTLFGRNPYAGVVNIVSKRPTNLWQGGFSTSYGSYESFTGDAYVMGPLVQDKLFFRLGGQYSERNGFLRNPSLNAHTDDQRQLSGSGALYWRPGRNWEVTLSASAEDYSDGAPRLTPLAGGPFVLNTDVRGVSEQKANSQALRIAYDGSSFDFLSVTSRRSWEIDPYIFDLDFSPFPGNDSQIVQEQDVFSQEFRFSSKKGSDWEWSAGAFFGATEVEGNTTRDFIVPLPDGSFFPATTATDYSLDEDAYALFGQLSFKGIDRVGLHLGLRFDYVEKEIDRDGSGLAGPEPNISLEDDYSFVSPRVGMDYELDESSLIYANTGLAFKPGGFSAFVGDSSLSPFDEERAWSTEIGWKKRWADDQVRTNLALFYNDIKDYQVERSLVATDYAVLNAESAESYGVELELQTELFDGFTIEGSLGLVHTEFDKFTDPLSGADLSGNNAPFVPEFDASLAATYRHSSGIFARVEATYQGRTYFDDFNTSRFQENGYTLLNAALGYETEAGVEWSAFGRNLTDEVYYQNISPDLSAGTVGSPSIFGVRCRYDF